MRVNFNRMDFDCGWILFLYPFLYENKKVKKVTYILKKRLKDKLKKKKEKNRY